MEAQCFSETSVNFYETSVILQKLELIFFGLYNDTLSTILNYLVLIIILC